MSKEIIDAAASYFGMDPAHLAQGTMAAGVNGLRFTFTVEVGADDYMGIADRMRAMREPVENDLGQTQGEPSFIVLPTVQEVMRNPVPFMYRPECADLVAKACGLSKSVRDQVEAECQRQIAEAQESVRATAEGIAAPPLSKAERNEVSK